MQFCKCNICPALFGFVQLVGLGDLAKCQPTCVRYRVRFQAQNFDMHFVHEAVESSFYSPGKMLTFNGTFAFVSIFYSPQKFRKLWVVIWRRTFTRFNMRKCRGAFSGTTRSELTKKRALFMKNLLCDQNRFKDARRWSAAVTVHFCFNSSDRNWFLVGECTRFTI